MKEERQQEVDKFFASCVQSEFFGLFQSQKPMKGKNKFPTGRLALDLSTVRFKHQRLNKIHLLS